MAILDPRIFRAYDIRGKADTQLSVDACRLIGHGFGTCVRQHYNLLSPRIAVGRDARTHSQKFETAVVEGLLSAGCEVCLLGAVPSPVNYFAICTQHLDGGIQVTASHNPPSDNGLKLQLRHAEAFSGERLAALHELILTEAFLLGSGKTSSLDAAALYQQHLTLLFQEVGKNFSAVIDTGNGIAGPLYSNILRATGMNLQCLCIEPDGTFPNHPADPSQKETLHELQKTVEREHAAAGFAFDGDGDRLGVVDETGRICPADEILLLLAEDHLSRHPQAPVVFTVSNSSILETEINRWGGRPLMTKVGHSFVEHAMTQVGAKLGGEQSGHFFCGEDYFSFDDALVAALRIVRILQQKKQPLSVLLKKYPKVFQAAEIRPYCADEDKTEVVEKIAQHFAKIYPVTTLDGARIDFGEGAWACIRQSNTSPCLSICMEARTPEKLQEIDSTILSHVKTYPEISLDEEE